VRPDEAVCEDETLRLYCNLGYANLGYASLGYATCVHLPAERDFDAVRFQIFSGERATLRVQFACERDHRPVLCGQLRYDRAAGCWIEEPEAWLIPLAEAAVGAWCERHGGEE
jgi:hypothetical protein